MATKIQTTARGGIVLKNEYYESNSGNVESNRGADLYAVSDQTIMLYMYDNRTSFSYELNEICYEIEVDALIELIKQNGKLSVKKENKNK